MIEPQIPAEPAAAWAAAVQGAAEPLELRRDLYHLLAASFLGPPTAALVAPLRDAETLAVLATLVGREAVAPLWLWRQPGTVTADLRQEYFDLLAVPTPRYLAPFESVSCDTREVDGQLVGGLLGGPSARAVERVYERAGFVLEVRELPDHVGCELAFMAELCARAAGAWREGDPAAAAAAARARRRFAREHLGRFAPALCGRLEERTSQPLLAGVARLTAALVTEEVAPGS